MTEKTEKLAVRLARIMGEVGYIQKKGRNQTQNYNYVREADVVDAIRGKLSAAGILMIPDVQEVTHSQNAKGTPIVTLRVKYILTDGEESIPFHSVGQGMDGGDKASNKAFTGATKYALKILFMIPTGDDAEADERTDKPEEKKSEPEDKLSIQEKVLAAAARIAAREGVSVEEIIKRHSTFKGNDGVVHFFTDPYNVPVPGDDNAAALKWLGKTLRGLRKDLDTDQTGLPLS